MITEMTTLGWALVALPIGLSVYAYLGYPLGLWLATRGKPTESAPPPAEWPMVSVVVLAYNEEGQIGGKIEALLR